jgi:hypothetical protein
VRAGPDKQHGDCRLARGDSRPSLAQPPHVEVVCDAQLVGRPAQHPGLAGVLAAGGVALNLRQAAMERAAEPRQEAGGGSPGSALSIAWRREPSAGTPQPAAASLQPLSAAGTWADTSCGSRATNTLPKRSAPASVS